MTDPLGPRPDFTDLVVPLADEGTGPADWLLSRFLPEFPQGFLAAWVSRTVPPGSLLLDPFGTSPQALIELAQAGYAVVSCMLNPVLRLTLERASRAGAPREAAAAFQELAGSARDGLRLDESLQALYRVRCPACGAPAAAQEYTWERGREGPERVLVDCPACHTRQESACEGELPGTDLTPARLARVRGLLQNRITAGEERLRADARALVEAHPPRALVVLEAVLSRLDALDLPPSRRLLLQGLLLGFLDQANSLWPVERGPNRPLQLTTPPRYREVNLWRALENELQAFSQAPRVRLLAYPERPEPGEIALFAGRARDLPAAPGTFAAAAGVLPRPNQAFWKLSAAWSAWLGDIDPDRSFTRMIVRDRYDWTWHARALEGLFQDLRGFGAVQGGLLALLPELEPAFLSAVLPAARAADWRLRAYGQLPERETAVLDWDAGLSAASSPASPGDIAQAAIAYLRYKREPADYLEMTSAALLSLEAGSRRVEEQEGVSLQSQLKSGFSDPSLFVHLGTGRQTLESGSWDLAARHETGRTGSDAVELELLGILGSGEALNLPSLETRVRAAFPALLAPLSEYLQALLASYAEPAGAGWRLKEREKASTRLETAARLETEACDLGRRLGYRVEAGRPLAWFSEDGKPAYRFLVSYHTGLLGELRALGSSEGEDVLVLPASRLDLLAYKRRSFPAFDAALAGWTIVKFRLMDRLLDNPALDREGLPGILRSDPVAENPDQLVLF